MHLATTKTKGKTTNYVKPGGVEGAVEEFDSLNPTNVKEIPGSKSGTLPDGSKVNVRHNISDNRPTPEDQKPNGDGLKLDIIIRKSYGY